MRTIFWDTLRDARRGFGLMVTAGGARSWVIQYRHAGQSRRMTLDRELTLDKARRKARTLLGNASEVDPLAAKRAKAAKTAEPDTLKAVALSYLKVDKVAQLRSVDQRRQTFERLIFPTLGKCDIASIRRSEINAMLKRIGEEQGPVMADHVLAYLRALFNWHASCGDDFHSPIVRGMALTKPKERRRQRVLSDDELRAVWRVASETPGPFGRFIQFILLSATRRNEARYISRREVTGSNWIIPAERHKSKLDFLLPLSRQAKAILDGMPVTGDKGFYFTHIGDVAMGGLSYAKLVFDQAVVAELQRIATERGDSAMLERLAEIASLLATVANEKAKKADRDAARAKLKKLWWTLHDLRRTGRTLMSRVKVNADHAEQALGHVIPSLRGTYDLWAYSEEKRDAFEALAAEISRIVSPQPDNVVPLPKRTRPDQSTHNFKQPVPLPGESRERHRRRWRSLVRRARGSGLLQP
jgi:hypothetical protein